MLKIDNASEPQTKVIIKPSQKPVVDIYEFSQNVLKELKDDNIPSDPGNYSIYFEKLLEKQESEFKQKLGDIVYYSDHSTEINESNIGIEKEVKQSFTQIKSMLQAVVLIYKNLIVMKSLVKKHISSLENNTNILTVQNVTNALSSDLEKLTALVDKHIELIKMNYEEISKIFKVVEEQAIYDSNYDVYNKKFLINTMQMEAESVKRYGYKSSFLLVKVHDRTMRKIKNFKEKDTILKSISAILLKTSRRSDIVSHYGDGCFAMVMKHTDIEGAKKACERILKILYNADYVIDGQKSEIDLQMISSSLDKDKSMEEILVAALDRLVISKKDEQPVCLSDGE